MNVLFGPGPTKKGLVTSDCSTHSALRKRGSFFFHRQLRPTLFEVLVSKSVCKLLELIIIINYVKY